MTTTHDAGPSTDTVASGYPDSVHTGAHTEASAWASSPLGAIEPGGPFCVGPDGPTDLFETDPEADPTPRRVGIMALTACGVALAAALGVTLFGYADVKPAVSPGTAPAPVVTEIRTTDDPAEVPAATFVAPGPVNAPRLPTAGPQARIPSGQGAPVGPSLLPPPSAPPAPAGPTIVVDLPPLPPLPPQPQQPDPEPKPLTPPDLDIAIPMPDVPDPPKPQPDDKLQIKPVPPTIGPALPPVVSAS